MFGLLVVRASLRSLNFSRQSYEGKHSNDLFHRLNVPEGIQIQHHFRTYGGNQSKLFWMRRVQNVSDR